MDFNGCSQDYNSGPQGKSCNCCRCCFKTCIKEPDFNSPYLPLLDKKKEPDCSQTPYHKFCNLPENRPEKPPVKKPRKKYKTFQPILPSKLKDLPKPTIKEEMEPIDKEFDFCYQKELQGNSCNCNQTNNENSCKCGECQAPGHSCDCSGCSDKKDADKKEGNSCSFDQTNEEDSCNCGECKAPGHPCDCSKCRDKKDAHRKQGNSCSFDETNEEDSCNCGECKAPGHPCDCPICRAKKDAHKKHRTSFTQDRNDTRHSYRSNSYEHSSRSPRNCQRTIDEMPSTSGRKSCKRTSMSPSTKRSLMKSELNETLLHPISSCGISAKVLDNKEECSSVTRERLLIEDNYNPGLIEDCVVGCKDFNAISFGMSFEDSQQIPKELPEESPMTLLEAFYKRIESEREHMTDALSSKLGFQELNENNIDLYFTCKPRTQLNEALSNLFKAEALYEESVKRGTGQDVTSYNIDIQETELPLVGGCPITVECFTGITTPNNTTRKSVFKQRADRNSIRTEKKKF